MAFSPLTVSKFLSVVKIMKESSTGYNGIPMEIIKWVIPLHLQEFTFPIPHLIKDYSSIVTFRLRKL